MGLLKTVEIDGREVAFKASAAIPRLYRNQFGRDIYKDISALTAKTSGQDGDNSTLDIESLEVFENIAYIMAKHADPTVPNTAEEWLDGFNTFSIYQVLPQLMSLWVDNTKVTAVAKKNGDQ